MHALDDERHVDMEKLTLESDGSFGIIDGEQNVC